MTVDIAATLAKLGVKNAEKAAEVVKKKSEQVSVPVDQWIKFADFGPFTHVGPVKARFTKPGYDDGTTDHGLIWEDADTGTVYGHASGTAFWVRELEDNDPQPGDVVVIEYKGAFPMKKDPKKKAHSGNITVAERAENEDGTVRPKF